MTVPEHYRAGERDLLAYMFEADPEGAAAFCRWNIVKYAQRAGKKGGPEKLIDDLDKLIDYASRWKAKAAERLKETPQT